MPALTSRDFKENDFVKVVEFLDRGVKIALEAQHATGKKSRTTAYSKQMTSVLGIHYHS